jgi:hypothetical protein
MEITESEVPEMKARLFRIALAVAMIAMFVEGLGARGKW